MSISNEVGIGSALRIAATPRSRFGIAAVAILLAAVALRTVHLGDLSLWTDELFSRYYADLFGLRYLWTTGLAHEDSPPIYYMAVQGWMWLFGDSEVALRSLSVLASTLAVPLAYALATQLWDERRGLVAASVMAFSPMQITFAQDARPYSLLLLPVGGVLLAIAHLLRGEARAPTLWLYGVAAVVAIYCHATAVFFVAACNVAVIGYLLLHQRGALMRWIAVNAVVAVVAIPELIGMLVQAQNGSGIAWIPSFSPLDVVRTFSALISGGATPVKFPGAVLSFLVLLTVAASILAARPDRPAAIVVIAIPAIFSLLIGIASLYQPIFIARVFCWLDLPLSLAIAYAVTLRIRLRSVTLVSVVVTMVIGLGYQIRTATNEPWRSLLHGISPELARADHVVLAPLTDPTAFAYYAPTIRPLESWDVGLRGSVENDYMPKRMGIRVVPSERIVSDVHRGETVWLIFRTPDLPYVKPLLAQLPPPRIDIERTCGAKIMCLAAMAW